GGSLLLRENGGPRQGQNRRKPATQSHEATAQGNAPCRSGCRRSFPIVSFGGRSFMRSRTMLPFIGALALATACGDTSQLDSAFGPNSVPDGTIVLERSRFEGDAGDTASLRAFVLDRRGRRFHVEELSWESADSSIAVVDSTGQLFLVQPGETQLHVDYKGTRLTASARASNRVTIAKVDIYPEPLSLTIGDEREMGLYIRYSNGFAIRNKLGVNWSSSDPSVA